MLQHFSSTSTIAKRQLYLLETMFKTRRWFSFTSQKNSCNSFCMTVSIYLEYISYIQFPYKFNYKNVRMHSEVRQKRKTWSFHELPIPYNKNSLYTVHTLTVWWRKSGNQQNWNSQKQHSKTITGDRKPSSYTWFLLYQTVKLLGLVCDTNLIGYRSEFSEENHKMGKQQQENAFDLTSSHDQGFARF